MEQPPHGSVDRPGDAPPARRQQGREAAVAGLLYGEFADSSGTAGARAISALRAEAAETAEAAEAADARGHAEPPLPRRVTTSRLVRAIRHQDPADGAGARASSSSGVAAVRSGGWRRMVRHPRAATLASAAVAVGLVIAVATVLTFAGGPADERAPTILLSNGAVSIITLAERRAVGRNDLLAPGGQLVTGAGSSARLRYADGTVLEVTANTRLDNLETANAQGAQKALRLHSGSLHAEIVHQPAGRPLLIATADAQAEVIGTRLILDAKTSDTRLSVEKGLVRLVRNADRKSVEVPAGKRVVAEETGALIVQDSPTPPPPVERPLTPVWDGTGSGLTGDYFNGIELIATERVATRLDPVIDFDWGFESSPLPELHHEFYSVRWHGQLEARFSEEYLFTTLSDDGVRLWIDGTLLIDNWFEHPELQQAAHCELSAGHRHTIVLEYCEWKRYALVRLCWQSRHQAREVVPRCQLYPDAATP